MGYYLPKTIMMEALWIVRDCDRIRGLAEGATPEELDNGFIFRQLRAVDEALDMTVNTFPAEIRPKLREAILLSWQDGQAHTWETVDSGTSKKSFYFARRRFLYELAVLLELAPDST